MDIIDKNSNNNIEILSVCLEIQPTQIEKYISNFTYLYGRKYTRKREIFYQ